MNTYNPDIAPDPKKWLDLSEHERMSLIEDYHRGERIRMPNHRVHAAIHAAVEAQVAEGEKIPVEKTLTRLMSEGLERHDAVHAIGGVLIEYMQDILLSDQKSQGRKKKKPEEIHQQYYDSLSALTATEWLEGYDDEDEEEEEIFLEDADADGDDEDDWDEDDDWDDEDDWDDDEEDEEDWEEDDRF